MDSANGEFMKSKLTIALALIALLASVVTAAATAGSLRVIGSGRASGQFAVTSATGSKRHTQAVYLRGYGRQLSGFAAIACSRGFSVGSRSATLNRMVSGRLYRLRLPMRGDCDVTASMSGSGRIRLQILAA
jgi:hypothetical protein